MNSYEENIPLTQEEISKIRTIFSQVSFDQLKINKYFFKPHLSDYSEDSRHGFTIEEVKKFYAQPQLISRGFKRKSKTGYQYTLCYDEGGASFVKVMYLFDEKPIEIFNAMRIFRNLDNSVKRRYGLRF